jgi:hypothetical protein
MTWRISPEEIEQILALRGLVVRRWEVAEGGAFNGATVDGNEAELDTQSAE